MPRKFLEFAAVHSYKVACMLFQYGNWRKVFRNIVISKESELYFLIYLPA